MRQVRRIPKGVGEDLICITIVTSMSTLGKLQRQTEAISAVSRGIVLFSLFFSLLSGSRIDLPFVVRFSRRCYRYGPRAVRPIITKRFDLNDNQY